MPPLQPVPTQFDTAEFRRSDGPREHNAASAWSRGDTGQGVTIAIVDTGVDEDSPEFTGRISPLSRDVAGGDRSISGSDDHGTHVAMVAAAARNNTGILGIAYNATIMALRTDEPGSCAADAPQDTDADCNFTDSAIGQAIDYASANGAKVINVSLGGEGATSSVRSAVAAAANRGSLVVISAGNESAAEPTTFATLLDQSANGGVIIVGSVDADGSMSDFSNRAGTGASAAHFMAALGDRICCSYENGQLYVDSEGFIYLFSGTSFSAPQVSGAAALLAQAFPNLTGREIADILLRSAYDVGAPGIDPVYGRGILDIARAFQPIGTTSLPGGAAVPLGDTTAAGSPAMGDALSTASLPAVVLDEYGRAYQAELAGTMRTAPPRDRLRSAIGTEQRSVSFASENTSLAFSIDASRKPGMPPRTGELRLGREDADQAKVLAARIATQLAPNLRLGFAYAEGADGLVAQLQGQDRPAFLIAPDAAGDEGTINHTDTSFALRRQFGPWGLTVSAEQGETVSGSDLKRQAAMTGRRLESGVTTYGLAFDRNFGALQGSAGLSWMAEDRTLLGGRFHDSFGLTGADTVFLDVQAGWQPAPGWRLGAMMRQGWTTAHASGLVAPGSQLVSRSWSLDVARQGVFAADDSLGLRLSQPLRVESGALNLALPIAYDYDTLLADYGTRSLALAPQGRELVAELAWRGRLLTGNAAASMFYRRDPGHYASLPDDKGVALQWSRKF